DWLRHFELQVDVWRRYRGRISAGRADAGPPVETRLRDVESNEWSADRNVVNRQGGVADGSKRSLAARDRERQDAPMLPQGRQASLDAIEPRHYLSMPLGFRCRFPGEERDAAAWVQDRPINLVERGESLLVSGCLELGPGDQF